MLLDRFNNFVNNGLGTMCARIKNGRTLLQEAASKGQDQIVKYLMLQARPHPNVNGTR
jgi:hypothetical protein